MKKRIFGLVLVCLCVGLMGCRSSGVHETGGAVVDLINRAEYGSIAAGPTGGLLNEGTEFTVQEPEQPEIVQDMEKPPEDTETAIPTDIPEETVDKAPDSVPSDTGATVVEIVDLTETEGWITLTALELFYEDGEYAYYFPSIKSDLVIVKYADQTQKPIKEALADGDVTVQNLEQFGILYYKESLTYDE